VAVCLNNDDPALLGHGKNGVSHDYYQAFMGWENLGLEGLGTMMENSLKWSAFEDQDDEAWINGINEAYDGKGVKGDMLRRWYKDFEKWCEWVIAEYPQEAKECQE
jgi:adenosine deaminase CECR1